MIQRKVLPLILLVAACSHDATQDKPPAPEWTKESTRIVDNGYIVYVESESASTGEKAKMKAEGLALSDLANECSFIPKGARIEDRYVDDHANGSTAFIKLAVEFQDCAEAQKAVDPDAVRRIANQTFMQQLKSYQDYQETGELSARGTPINMDELALANQPEMPVQQGSSEVHFYVMRQYVAYQKEVIILAPPNSFAPRSLETQNYIARVTPAVQQINTVQAAQPNLVKAPVPWSRIPNRPALARPMNLAPPRRAAMPSVVPPPGYPARGQYQGRNGYQGNSPNQGSQKYRRRKKHEGDKE